MIELKTTQHICKGLQSIETALKEVSSKRYMIVHDPSFHHLPVKDHVKSNVMFDDFTSNPLYEQVCKGVELFNAHHCDAIIAVGGGSTIDVAKCIKLFCKMDPSMNYLQQEFCDSGVPLIAIPTTAGTGSESTRYAVIYYEGKKQSITHESIIPTYAILEPRLLKTLPIYQKKCTMLDAMCQCIESLWSVNSTDESMLYAKIGLQMIMDHWHGYIEENNEEDAKYIMMAANYGGRAINISQTTAPHAMSYKLTSMYGLPHGHAVALCMTEVWSYILEHTDCCIDSRGKDHLEFVLELLGQVMLCDSPEKGRDMFRAIMFELEMGRPQSSHRKEDIELLTQTVNPIRLKNNPVGLSKEVIYNIYNRIID